ncbi:hypothetical protein MTO96_047863 [Rhipicephalus appendiculatus]
MLSCPSKQVTGAKPAARTGRIFCVNAKQTNPERLCKMLEEDFHIRAKLLTWVFPLPSTSMTPGRSLTTGSSDRICLRAILGLSKAPMAYMP